MPEINHLGRKGRAAGADGRAAGAEALRLRMLEAEVNFNPWRASHRGRVTARPRGFDS